MTFLNIQLVIMSDFSMYFNIGMRHVLDIKAFGHVLFLTALVGPYAFKDWKRIFLLISIFTIGFLLTLLISFFGILVVKIRLIKLLLLLTIVITAV